MLRLVLFVILAGGFVAAGWFGCRTFGPRGETVRRERPQPVPAVAVATLAWFACASRNERRERS